MYINWYNSINEEYGFEGLKICFTDGKSNYFDPETIFIETWQIENGQRLRKLWRMQISTKYINAKDLLEKLKIEYNGKVTHIKLYGLYTEVTIYDKKYEVLEWLDSIALIDKLVN